jgi:phosphatidylinositol alpha-1,6-mannosyltransferase
LIRALPAIRNAVPEVLYVIVGDGEERAQLEQLVDQMGVRDQVQFRGESDDKELVECFQQCDLFVLPNREVNGDIEGFGMVLIEAQACGKPVIAGASGGTAETMQVEKTGLVVDCSRPEPLSNAVCRILLDFPRKQQMGKAARQHAIHQFEWQHLTARAAQLLKLRLGSGNGAGPDMESPAAISGRECERQLTSHTA